MLRSNRFTPQPDEIQEEVALAAHESTDQRIIRTLEQLDEQGDETFFVRPQCPVATITATSMLGERRPVQVHCPKDELRRANTHASLLIGGTNLISLFPFTEEEYVVFAERMQQSGEDDGNYILYHQDGRGLWEIETL